MEKLQSKSRRQHCKRDVQEVANSTLTLPLPQWYLTKPSIGYNPVQGNKCSRHPPLRKLREGMSM